MAITGKTRIVGVFGFPVEHSLSPAMQNTALRSLGLDWTYIPFSVDPSNIGSAIASVRALGLVGVNVTVPLKELVAPFLNKIDPVAARIGSVNTVVNVDGQLCGYSTDGQGLLWDLVDKKALPPPGGSVLVIGAGGSARAVVDLLAKEDFEVALSNRTEERAYRLVTELGVKASVIEWAGDPLLNAVKKADLIINTTTLGMSSAQGGDLSIFAPRSFGTGKVLYDLVYSPPETPLMRIARSGGATAYNGLGMLVRQGAISLQLWSGLPLNQIPVAQMDAKVAGRIL